MFQRTLQTAEYQAISTTTTELVVIFMGTEVKSAGGETSTLALCKQDTVYPQRDSLLNSVSVVLLGL